MNVVNYRLQVGTAAAVDVRARDQSAVAKPSEVDANRSNSVAAKFVGYAHHIRRRVIAEQAMDLDGDSVARYPLAGLVVVNHQTVTVK